MLNKFTAAKKIRRQDDYSPGGEAGHRPDRATLVYANRMKEAYSDVAAHYRGHRGILTPLWSL